jgi:hypothetical protein
MVDDTYDQFVARSEVAEIRDLLRQASNHPAAHKYERALLESPLRGEGRMMLARLAHARMRETFVATIAGRGFNGRQRTVLLQDLRLFGSKFIEEDHLWMRCNALWERIEPFLQGEKVVLVGTATEYTRKNQTCDFNLALDYVTKLWPPNKTTVPSCNQSSLSLSPGPLTASTGAIRRSDKPTPPLLTRRQVACGITSLPPFSKHIGDPSKAIA